MPMASGIRPQSHSLDMQAVPFSFSQSAELTRTSSSALSPQDPWWPTLLKRPLAADPPLCTESPVPPHRQAKYKGSCIPSELSDVANMPRSPQKVKTSTQMPSLFSPYNGFVHLIAVLNDAQSSLISFLPAPQAGQVTAGSLGESLYITSQRHNDRHFSCSNASYIYKEHTR